MAECELMFSCAYYSNVAQRRLSESDLTIKRRYCLVDSSQCSCYRVLKFCGKRNTPVDLQPSEFERAEQLIFEEKQRRKGKNQI